MILQCYEATPQTIVFYYGNMDNYTNQFNMKWKKNQHGDRKVVGQATMLAHWAQNVGGQLPK